MKHGANCNCKECKKIKKYLTQQEQKGKIKMIGIEEDLKKIRGQ